MKRLHPLLMAATLVILGLLLFAQVAQAAPENRCYWDGRIAVYVTNPHHPFGTKQMWHIPDPTCDMYLIESAQWKWCEVDRGFFGGIKKKCHHRDTPTVNRLIEKLTRDHKRWEFEVMGVGSPNLPLAIEYSPVHVRYKHSYSRYLMDNTGDRIGLFHYEYFPEDYEDGS